MAWSRTAAPLDTTQPSTNSHNNLNQQRPQPMRSALRSALRSQWGLNSQDGRWCGKRPGVKLPSSKLDWSLWNCQLLIRRSWADRQPALITSILISILEIDVVAQIRMFFLSEILILLIWSNNFHTIQHMEMVMLTLTQIFHNNNLERAGASLLICIVCIDLN